MPRWKETKHIISLKDDGEFFNDDWMNYNNILQYIPPSIKWHGNRLMKIEDVDIWEVIVETSGPIGVYAAWCPYEELYIVTNKWKIVEEFSGWRANERLEKYLIANNILYPKINISPEDYEYISKTIII